MLSTLLVVLPIFALIFAGWLTRRIGVLGAAATTELNRFVVFLALPALLFDVTAHAHWSAIWKPGFIGAFGLSSLAVFGLTVMIRRGAGRPLADAAVDGLNAGYANTGFMGFPLILAVVGQSGMAPTLVATIVTVCVLFAVAIVLIEASLQSQARRRDIARKTLLALIRNPLLVAPALGALVMVSGWPLPQTLDRFLKLLGGAASPCALIALGLFLAEKTGRAAEAGRRVEALLIGLKLVAHPVATWVIAAPILGLAPDAVHTAVLLAALPTGTGPFMLAEFYGRQALVTSRVVLATTLLSVATLSLYLAVSR